MPRNPTHHKSWERQLVADLCDVIIAATVSDECSRIEVLGTEGMITIEVVVLEKCKQLRLKLREIFSCTLN